MKKLVVLIFLLVVKFSFSQENINYGININTEGSWSVAKMNIKIKRATDSIKIVYKKLVGRDTIAEKKMDKQEILNFFKKFDSETDAEKKKRIFQEFNSVMNSYEIFKKDSLIFPISQKALYTSLIDSVYVADKEVLENSIQNKHRIVLDGTRYNIEIIANDTSIKSIWVHSPTSESHPLIKRLIDGTLNIYKESNPDSFLE